jgi:hypothetical protein
MQPRLYGGDRNSKSLCGFLRREFLHMTQIKNVLVDRMELIDRLGNDCPELSCRAFFFRVHPPLNRLETRCRMVAIYYFIERRFAVSPVRAQPHQRFVCRNAKQPCRESSMPLKTLKVTESLKQSGLNYIFCVFSVTKYPLGEPKDSALVRHYEPLKCIHVSVSCHSQKPTFSRFGECI